MTALAPACVARCVGALGALGALIGGGLHRVAEAPAPASASAIAVAPASASAVGVAGSAPAAATAPARRASRRRCPPARRGPSRSRRRRATIVIKVEGDLAPIAAGNFVALARAASTTASSSTARPGFVIQGGDGQFVIQGGDPNGDGSGGPGYTIQDEPVTTAVQARDAWPWPGRRGPNSQGSQFFIVLDDSGPALAPTNTYAIFGHVTHGHGGRRRDRCHARQRAPSMPDSNPVAHDQVTVANPVAQRTRRSSP